MGINRIQSLIVRHSLLDIKVAQVFLSTLPPPPARGATSRLSTGVYASKLHSGDAWSEPPTRTCDTPPEISASDPARMQPQPLRASCLLGPVHTALRQHEHLPPSLLVIAMLQQLQRGKEAGSTSVGTHHVHDAR